MRSIILCFLLIVGTSLFGQTDTSKTESPLDKLNPDELLQYYLNENPPQWPKGPLFVGDTLFNELNNSVVPTTTLNGEGLYYGSIDSRALNDLETGITPNEIQTLRPKVALGMGRLGFYGDLYEKRFQSPLVSRMGFDLNVSQRLTRYLQLNFNVLFGKLGANEVTPNRYENFQSEIRAGGLNLVYDFGNFIPDLYKVRPFVSVGITGFEFLSKTDLMDGSGNIYHYWNDGSIKDKAEGSANAMFAKDLKRDYIYETDIRERNADGFGKYPERSFAIPIGAGFVMQAGPRVDVKFNFQLFFTGTDYIDGITKDGKNERSGTKSRDNFSYSSVSLQYDLLAPKTVKPPKDAYKNTDWLAIDNEDSDKDGVRDWDDKCHGTPPGVKVNAFGCPEDDDNDGVPNYMDDENPTAAGLPVNARGVAQTDEYWARWYAEYMDTVGLDKKIQYVGNVFDLAGNKPRLNDEKTMYTIELGRYANGVPAEEMAVLLSVGDIRSTTLEDGTTVIYTAGSYDKISKALKRKEQFEKDGKTNAKVSSFKNKKIESLSELEVNTLLEKEKANDLALNAGASNTPKSDTTNVASETTNGSSTNSNSATSGSATTTPNNASNNEASTAPNEAANDADVFGKDDIVYRVQLGAYKNKINPSIFNTSAGVLELKMGENLFRYVTRGYKTIEDAASVRADLVIQGYSDAFVTAYQGGKRIPLNKTKATVDKNFKEDLDESKVFSSIDKKLVNFKIQLGALKKPAKEAEYNELYKDITNLDKQNTNTGMIRYTTGSFTNYEEAEKYRKQLEDNGFSDGFIIATFKSEIISIQEALELLK